MKTGILLAFYFLIITGSLMGQNLREWTTPRVLKKKLTDVLMSWKVILLFMKAMPINHENNNQSIINSINCHFI